MTKRMLNIDTIDAYIDDFRDCCRIVAANCSNEYAKAYAEAGLNDLNSQEAMRVQCLYILSSTTHWRGTLAKATKAKLKELSKQHGD